MKRHPLWLARRLPVRGSEQGATLIYALLFTTVIALVIAAVLGLADANLRATRALRQQAAEAAAADGAAKIAINTLRTGNFNGTSGQCLDGALELANFYQPADGPAVSTRVECTYDDGASVKPGATGAGFALLTLPEGGQEGVNLKANGCGSGGSGANCGGMEVHGDVYSTGRTNVESGQLVVSGDFTSASCLIGTTASVRDDSGPIVVTSPECATPSPVGDPGYVVPGTPDQSASWSSCNGGVRTFEPGLYDTDDDLDALNNKLPGPPCSLSYFKPGIYWFAFNGEWETKNHTVVAGAVTAPPVNVDLATACPSPFTDHNPDAGVTFVFGGNARWKLGMGGKAAVCAAVSQVPNQPPIALFGLTSSVTGAAGTVSPPASESCILRDKDATGSNKPCATFQTINHSDIELYLNGATYLPRGWVDLDLRSSKQYIVGGLVVRQFSLFAPASATLPEPLSSGPLPGGPGGARTVVYLAVYVCPGAGSCPTGDGTLRLKAKVAIFDPNGLPAESGARPITVLSWSVQR